MKKISKFIPLIFVCVAVFFLVLRIHQDNLEKKKPEDFFQSTMVGKKIPLANFEFLTNKEKPDERLFKGKTTVVNLFASWCVACVAEHSIFMEFAKNNPQTQIIGVNWRDKELDAKMWLKKHGNPYNYVIKDSLGKYGIKLGIRGVPETFIVNEKSEIIAHRKGNIDKGFLINNVK